MVNLTPFVNHSKNILVHRSTYNLHITTSNFVHNIVQTTKHFVHRTLSFVQSTLVEVLTPYFSS